MKGLGRAINEIIEFPTLYHCCQDPSSHNNLMCTLLVQGNTGNPEKKKSISLHRVTQLDLNY